MQTPYRGQPKIVVAAMQNAFPPAEAVKPVRLDGQTGKISGQLGLLLQDAVIGRFDDQAQSNSSILRLAYGLFLPFWELAANFCAPTTPFSFK